MPYLSSILYAVYTLLFCFQEQVVWTDASGTQFAVSLPRHHTGVDSALYLHVESRYETNTVHIEAPGLNLDQTVYRGVTRINLDVALAEDNGERPRNTIFINSQTPITVHLMDYVQHSADGILLLPISKRNTEYFVVTPSPNVGSSQLAVTTATDNTHVNIRVKTASGSFLFDSRSYSNGDLISLNLNRLESIQIQHDSDLTGTHITSDHPISVVSGDYCVNIPAEFSACDHVISQLPPVSVWGRTHVISNLRTRNLYMFRVLSARDYAHVQISHYGNYTLHQGNFIEKQVLHDEVIAITADQPVLVVQFSEGTESDSKPGDPFMTVIPPIEHFSDSYIFTTPDSFVNQHLTITIESSHVLGLRLNGLAVDRADSHFVNLFNQGTNMRFSVIRIGIAPGTYNLTHTNTGVRFGALLYGFGDAQSYGYPLGYDLSVRLGVHLSIGNTSKSGILQVDVGGVLTPVCADGVGVEEAQAVCKTMGYDKYPLTSKAVQRLPRLQAVSQHLPRLSCPANQLNIRDCGLSLTNAQPCSTTDQILIDCAPQLPEIVRSRCTTSRWNIDIDMDKLNYRYPGSVATDLYLGDNSCHGYTSGHLLSFRYDIDSCLTEQKETNDNLVYSNELVYAYHDPVHPFIIRNYNWTLDVTCLVPRNQSTHTQVAYNQSTAVDASLNSTIQYKPKMQMFSDPNFMNPIHGSPIQVALGTNVYVKTYVDHVDWSLRMKLTSCYTSPSQPGGALKYYLIRNGCEVDANTHLISEAAHETRFVFSMFEMTSNHQSLFLHCDATICDTSDVTSRAQCNLQCNRGR